jgi:preprotein translocase SecE subunit
MPKDDAFWLTVGYLVFAGLISYVAWLAFETVGIQTGWAERYDQWYNPTSVGVSLVIGLLATFILRHSKERQEYFLSSIAEVRKVSWPSLDDTRKMTIIVCIVVAVFSVILSVFDVVWAAVLKKIIV